MSQKMQINRLDKDELIYELTVRGIGTGRVEEMRHRLLQAMQLEKEGDSIKYPPYPFKFDEDCDAVTKTLEVIEGMVDKFNDGSKSNAAVKLHTKFSHTMGRLNNMVGEDVEKQQKKSELLARILSLRQEFSRKIEEFESKQHGILPTLSFVAGQAGPSTFHAGLGNVSTSSSLGNLTDPGGRQSGSQHCGSIKTIPPHKWNIQKYTGDKRCNMSINAFFEHVEELRAARNVSPETLLNSGIDLFCDKAYQFYKDCRDRVTTWDELVTEFKNEFLSAHYEEDLFEELRHRTQHPTESIGVYLAVMSSYFNRLARPISEDVKLTIILKNLHPYYLERLRDPMPSSLDELRSACRSMEARRDTIRNYVEPSSRRNCFLERDLAYIDASGKVDTVETSSSSNRSTGSSKPIVCFRCQQPGHKAVGCAQTKKLTCFKCRKEGFTGRIKSVEPEKSTKNFQPILDFILDHAQNDERPYLRIDILGKTLLGLLDSGASTTIVGGRGYQLIKDFGFEIDVTRRPKCTIANGQSVASIGECDVPMCVRGKVKLVKVLVVPQLPHALILGTNFWKAMGIVPDLRRNEWHFSDQPICLDEVDHLRGKTTLTELQEACLQAVVRRNKHLMGESLGCTDLVEHVIVTKSPPIKQRYYPVSPVIQAQIDRELEEMLKQGIVEKSNSGWSSPILLVKKKDGGYRFCVDFRKLNKVTERDSYPLPYVTSTLDKLRDAHYLSSLDIKSAYWQVPMAESSKQFTAFTVPGRGLFQFRRMPFGLHNSPATWQRLIDRVLGADLEPHVFVYLDDVVVVTQTFEQHLAILEEVFRRLREAKLTVSWEKCQFCRPEMKYLGYMVDRNGLHVDSDKVKAMLQLPTPTNVREVRRVVGTFSWYRRFIPDFATIITPLTELLKKSKKFVWTEKCSISDANN
ncbi:uncharacterized protein LOC111692437 [Anoplophora glabripennis]|uniref:uncharacterized protein LOC111692437 n=1 Tax=Anoplophora glabripennis TaxID=217634 RepID=UPI000C76D5AC|nr:uncharacterized protein LOC111692437 [Anoplophora glabripennis]